MASFSTCPDCGGDDPRCFRCDGTGLICDRCGESEAACRCGDEEEEDARERIDAVLGRAKGEDSS